MSIERVEVGLADGTYWILSDDQYVISEEGAIEITDPSLVARGICSVGCKLRRIDSSKDLDGHEARREEA